MANPNPALATTLPILTGVVREGDNLFTTVLAVLERSWTMLRVSSPAGPYDETKITHRGTFIMTAIFCCCVAPVGVNKPFAFVTDSPPYRIVDICPGIRNSQWKDLCLPIKQILDDLGVVCPQRTQNGSCWPDNGHQPRGRPYTPEEIAILRQHTQPDYTLLRLNPMDHAVQAEIQAVADARTAAAASASASTAARTIVQATGVQLQQQPATALPTTPGRRGSGSSAGTSPTTTGL